MSTPGQAVLGIVGAVVGFYIGGPGGAYYGFMVGLAVGGALFPPSIDTPRPTPGQLSLQTSTYGGCVPVVFGARRISGNLLWIGALQTHEQEDSSGGKGGKGGGGSISYTYSISMAWGLCMGRKTVIKAWAGKDDITEAGFADCATIYDGTQTAADPLIAAAVARAPVWKNLCYVVMNDYPLGNSPAIPNFTFEVADLEEWCFQEAGKLEAPTDARHRLLYSDGKLYVANNLASEIKVSKIDPATMAEEASISFPKTSWNVNSTTGALIDLPGLNRIALCLNSVAAGYGGWYIFELSKSDLSILDEMPVGDVCRGSDNNLYVCKYWAGDSPECAPITGEYWTLEFVMLDPGATKYGTLRSYGGGTFAPGDQTVDCCPIYENGFYYIPIPERAFIKKDRSTGENVLWRGGYEWHLAHGEDGYLYSTYGVGIGMHIHKVLKETLDMAADFSDPMIDLTAQIIFENGYLYIAARGSGEIHRVLKMRTDTGEIVATYAFSPGSGGISDLKIMGSYLIACGDCSLTKLRKANLSFVCSETFYGNGLATDGSYLYLAKTNPLAQGIVKYALSGMGGDVTPQSITRGITTNNLWGLGLDASIWETTKTAAAEAFATEKDLLMSVIFDHQRSVLDALQYILQHHDGFITYMDGQLAHRQLTMEGEAVQFSLSPNLTDDFADGVKGAQWEKIE
jgi:hypothetical protein